MTLSFFNIKGSKDELEQGAIKTDVRTINYLYEE